MATTTMRTCDLCGRAGNVTPLTRWEIKQDGEGKITIDLCERDEEPMRKLLQRLPETVRRGRRRSSMDDSFVADPSLIPRTGDGAKVTPMRRPAKKAAAAKKSTAKKATARRRT